VLADKGYQGSSFCFIPYKGENLLEFQVATNLLIGKARITIERSIRRVKNYNCLRIAWRHELSLHPPTFRVCSEIANILMDYYPLNVDDGVLTLE
jgi:hypothetical protein